MVVVCPKCDGTGTVGGLPDSMSDRSCEQCNSTGYVTERQLNIETLCGLIFVLVIIFFALAPPLLLFGIATSIPWLSPLGYLVLPVFIVGGLRGFSIAGRVVDSIVGWSRKELLEVSQQPNRVSPRQYQK